jgi:hypothetical protein
MITDWIMAVVNYLSGVIDFFWTSDVLILLIVIITIGVGSYYCVKNKKFYFLLKWIGIVIGIGISIILTFIGIGGLFVFITDHFEEITTAIVVVIFIIYLIGCAIEGYYKGLDKGK